MFQDVSSRAELPSLALHPSHPTPHESELSPPSLPFQPCWNQEMRFQLLSTKSSKYLQRIFQAQGPVTLGAVGRGSLPGPTFRITSGSGQEAPTLGLCSLSPPTAAACFPAPTSLPQAIHGGLPAVGAFRSLPEKMSHCPGAPSRLRGSLPTLPHPEDPSGGRRREERAEDPCPLILSGTRCLGAGACFLMRRKSYPSSKGGPSAFTGQPAGRRLSLSCEAPCL